MFSTISLSRYSENKQPNNVDFAERKGGPWTLRKCGPYAKIYDIS